MSNWVLLLALSFIPFTTVMAKSILVFGDSISAAYGMEVQQGWVTLLQKKLAAEHNNYLISNASISGETTAGGLSRIDAALSQYKPDIVVLELGANDGLRGLSAAAMKTNLTEMIKRSQTAGAKVLLLGMKIPPNYGKRYIEMFYSIYPQLAETLHIPLLPFLLEDVALQPDLMQADGLHPNALAQPAIAAKVWQYLQPLIK
ncbi:arylesterase [Methylomonas paludis]|uniref:Arylesterase n=1 Tax=Methylomonas paludis TaxID=1173101 RepID=A0A975RAN8_9GAMM|nr:arylesterase [Methylomonas paludis]QWF71421.1 arylesterase [Methylomonas paludis]